MEQHEKYRWTLYSCSCPNTYLLSIEKSKENHWRSIFAKGKDRSTEKYAANKKPIKLKHANKFLAKVKSQE